MGVVSGQFSVRCQSLSGQGKRRYVCSTRPIRDRSVIRETIDSKAHSGFVPGPITHPGPSAPVARSRQRDAYMANPATYAPPDHASFKKRGSKTERLTG